MSLKTSKVSNNLYFNEKVWKLWGFYEKCIHKSTGSASFKLKHSMIINISTSLKKQIQKYKTKSIVFGSQYLTDMKKKLLKILKPPCDTKVN